MTKEQIILLTSGIVLFVILVLVIIFLVRKKPKRKRKNNIDQEFINQIVTFLGVKENIDNIDVVETKLKINVVNLKLCQLENLKNITEGGIFVTGNVIKILFKYDSNELKEELNHYKGV